MTQLGQHDAEDAQPVTHRVELALPVHAGLRDAGDVDDAQPGLGGAHVEDRLDLEAVAPPHVQRLLAAVEAQDRQHVEHRSL
jgi:hypothetical protein